MCCCAIMEAAPSRKRRSRHADTARTSFHHQPPTHAHTFHLSHPHLPPPPQTQLPHTMLRIEIRARGYLGVPTASVHLVRVGAVADGRQREAARSRCADSNPALHRPSVTSLLLTPQLTASPPPFLLPHQTQTPTPPQRCGRAAPARQPIASAACRRRLASRATRSCARSARRCSSRTSPRSRGTLSSGSRSSLPSE